jgi:hypothetical protein
VVVVIFLQEGHLYHKPSGVSFFSLVEVVIPSFIRLNQLIDFFRFDEQFFQKSPLRSATVMNENKSLSGRGKDLPRR